MPTFEQGEVVSVPFPYTDRNTRQRRPALVVSDGAIGDGLRLLWVVMITSAENRPWVADVPIRDHAAVGLPAASIIRTAKIATIEALQAERLGTIDPRTLEAVIARIRTLVRAGD